MSFTQWLNIAALCVFLGVTMILIMIWCVKKLSASRCPKCGGRWDSHVYDDWADKEWWHCEACDHFWEERA